MNTIRQQYTEVGGLPVSATADHAIQPATQRTLEIEWEES